MKHGFFPRLAWDGIRKNSRMYVPYWITCQLCVCIFYLLCSLRSNPVINRMSGGSTTVMVLALGCIVIGIFSILFLFYTNAFLIRQRMKEFGLYNVLGMDRRAISRILCWDSLITAIVTLASGLVTGIALSKLGELLLVRMVGSTPHSGFHIQLGDIILTVLFFGFVDLLLLLNAVRHIRFTAITGLLRSSRIGERPPKANWVLAVLGMILLGFAYWMAVTIQQPLTALLLFFAAVILVIIATYLLMIAGSVTLCRTLQRRKAYYYRPEHFISVSSMVYRMKRNGAGLASICVLATMVLVMISSTACLYFGSEDALCATYPREMDLQVSLTSGAAGDAAGSAYRNMITTTIDEAGITPSNVIDFRSASVFGLRQGNTITLDSSKADANPALYDRVVTCVFIDLEEYNRSATIPLSVAPDQVLLYTNGTSWNSSQIVLDSVMYPIAGILDSFELHTTYESNAFPTLYLIVCDLSASIAPLSELHDANNTPMLSVEWQYCFDTGVDAPQQLELLHQLRDRCAALPQVAHSFSCREAERTDYYGTFGGFFFLGILLSVVFLAATAVIIYYKQLSEGYEDQDRFAIMQKVGLDRDDIRKSINSQMRTVFFFPIGLAVIHLCFAFPMIRKLLLLFYLNNLPLLIATAALSTLIFALFYGFVYRRTTRIYYRLVAPGKSCQ